MSFPIHNIRNFSIISHINHGKSTLSDRFLELTQNRKHQKIDKLMDSMELEKERGITIKLNTACLKYKLNELEYKLNLIDTPGHVDFSYEVSRSLSACEGVILLVDAIQGIQAQTLSNLNAAQKQNLKIIPVINKIDLKHVEIEKIQKLISKLLKVKINEISLISAKKNIGIKALLERVIKEIPAPQGNINLPTQGLIFDAFYDQYQGVTLLVRMMNGKLKNKDRINILPLDQKYEISELLVKTPELKKINELHCGDVGLIQANIKNIKEIQIGMTITLEKEKKTDILDGYQKITPVVFANFFAMENNAYKNLEKALEKIALNDASLQFQKISTFAFGHGFYCGFLGLLHLEIIRDRIIREYKIDIVVTSPTVKYHFIKQSGEKMIHSNIMQIDDWTQIREIQEPVCKVNVILPISYLGETMTLIKKKRGNILNQSIISDEIIKLETYLPLAEIVIDFFDLLKSISNGYASFDYHIDHYEASSLIRLNILINGQMIGAFSRIVHKKEAYQIGRNICQRLKTLIPRENFQISIQASINNKIIARENIPALRKSVAAKCYGGDITRKRKLWEKQKKGKLKMKKFGRINLPNKVFLEILKNKN